jgi:hypothetical protein
MSRLRLKLKELLSVSGICLALVMPLLLQAHIDDHAGQPSDSACVICLAKFTSTMAVQSNQYELSIIVQSEYPYLLTLAWVEQATFSRGARSPPV